MTLHRVFLAVAFLFFLLCVAFYRPSKISCKPLPHYDAPCCSDDAFVRKLNKTGCDVIDEPVFLLAVPLGLANPDEVILVRNLLQPELWQCYHQNVKFVDSLED